MLDNVIKFLLNFIKSLNFHTSSIFGCNLDVRDAINAIFIGVDKDRGDGKAKKNKSTKESDLSDWYEPEHKKK